MTEDHPSAERLQTQLCLQTLSRSLSEVDLNQFTSEIQRLYQNQSLPHGKRVNENYFTDRVGSFAADRYPSAGRRGWLFGIDTPERIETLIHKSLKPAGKMNYIVITYPRLANRVIGYSRLHFFHHEDPEGYIWTDPEGESALTHPHVELEEIVVSDEGRELVDSSTGLKASQLLLQKAENLTLDRDVHHLFAWVVGPNLTNRASYEFFRKNGFRPVSLVESFSDTTVAAGLLKDL